jgi:two-component system NtrC family sensor kinase
MHCPRCQHDNPSGQKFCGACGTPLTANPSGPPASSFSELTSALSEAREQQAAAAEILRVISSSPTDIGPVFETILDRALRLCNATMGGVVRHEGGLVSHAAIKGPPALAEAARAAYPRRLTDSGLEIRAIRERTTVHVAELLADRSSIYEIDEHAGLRSQLSVPMLKHGEAIGAITVLRADPGLFSDQQVKLLESSPTRL